MRAQATRSKKVSEGKREGASKKSRKKLSVLMVGSEAVPFAKTGGLADVVGTLPKVLKEQGVEVALILPEYSGIAERYKLKSTGIKASIPIVERDETLFKEGEILEVSDGADFPVFLVKRDEYYYRKYLYSMPEGDYPDNAARFVFFSRMVLEFLKAGGFSPTIIHCNDWQSALVPVYLKTLYKDEERLSGIKTVLTIHNLGYQGIFWQWDMKLIGLDWSYFTPDYLEYYNKVNFLKGGIVFSDVITTVSKKYALEIQTPEFGVGLDGVIRTRAKDIYGIINGLDYNVWNPEIDQAIKARYSIKDLTGKKLCKADLQREFSLPEDPNVPLIGSVGRLADQKGFDLVASAIEEIISRGVQFVILGTGEKHYHELVSFVVEKYPKQVGAKIGFDDVLAHKIEAGADMFLMPSRYEPCGLNQLISLKYGTVPIVRATGGLDDTIKNFDLETGKGNGFKFEEYSKEALLQVIDRALAIYKQPKLWEKLMKNGMKEDNSWTASVKEYIKLYKKLLT